MVWLEFQTISRIGEIMDNKIVSLFQLTNLKDDSASSESFVRYVAGLSSIRKYKHQEILDIDSLISSINLSISDSNGFLFGYIVPRLNKEFDLIKLTDKYVLNIELKCQPKKQEDILRQLIQNAHYLKMLGRKVYCFEYISSNKQLLKLSNNELCEAEFHELEKLCLEKYVAIDLDDIFSPKNVLVSPLNDTERFLCNDYLLTENQENIKKDILNKMNNSEAGSFFGLTGGPGTGKTLLLYDIAKELSKNKRVLIIHGGLLCDGHSILRERMPNIKISEAKELKQREIKNVDYVLVDESQRLYESAIDKIERWVKKAKAVCIFSFDPNQRVSHHENDRKTVDKIENLCGENKARLTSSIRTNKEMILFMSCLFDLKKYKPNYNFEHIKLLFEPNKEKAAEFAKVLEGEGFEFISITPSFFDTSLDYQKGKKNTHTVIGQEFEKACMILDSNFYYENGCLRAKRHPNPDYIFTKLLQQGITRARSGLALIVTDKELLLNIMRLFPNNDMIRQN